MDFMLIHGDVQKYEFADLRVQRLQVEADNCLQCQNISRTQKKSSLVDLMSVSDQITQQIQNNIAAEAKTGSVSRGALIRAVGRPLLQKQVRDFLVEVRSDFAETQKTNTGVGMENKGSENKETSLFLGQEKHAGGGETYEMHYRIGNSIGVNWKSTQAFEDERNISWGVAVTRNLTSGAKNSLTAELKNKIDRESQVQLRATILTGGTRSATLHYSRSF